MGGWDLTCGWAITGCIGKDGQEGKVTTTCSTGCPSAGKELFKLTAGAMGLLWLLAVGLVPDSFNTGVTVEDGVWLKG